MNQPNARHALSERTDSPVIRPIVLSPTYDAIVVEASLVILNGLRADGYPASLVAEFVAEHIADEVARHAVKAA